MYRKQPIPIIVISLKKSRLSGRDRGIMGIKNRISLLLYKVKKKKNITIISISPNISIKFFNPFPSQPARKPVISSFLVTIIGIIVSRGVLIHSYKNRTKK